VPLALDTSFGVGGTFSIDFGSGTANSNDGALGLAFNPSNGDLVTSGYSDAGLSGGAKQIAMADVVWTPKIIINPPPPAPPPLGRAAAQPISTTTISSDTSDPSASAGSDLLARHKGWFKLTWLNGGKG
jgi:hypothetical protein